VNCRDDCRVARGDAAALRSRIDRCVATECPIRASGDWTCIGRVSPPAPSSPFTVAQYFLDQQSLLPLPGLSVELCSASDPQCAQPLRQATTDDAGACSLEVPGLAFPGYFHVHGTSGAAQYDAVVYHRPLLTAEKQFVPSVGTVASLAESVGAPLDPTRGALYLVARDCSGVSAAGVSFTASTADQASVTFYVVEGIPSLSTSQTAPLGQGGIANLRPGYTKVTATINGLCSAYGRIDVLVRAGAITLTNFPPTPL
jgi:hypothetical protein